MWMGIPGWLNTLAAASALAVVVTFATLTILLDACRREDGRERVRAWAFGLLFFPTLGGAVLIVLSVVTHTYDLTVLLVMLLVTLPLTVAGCLLLVGASLIHRRQRRMVRPTTPATRHRHGQAPDARSRAVPPVPARVMAAKSIQQVPPAYTSVYDEEGERYLQ